MREFYDARSRKDLESGLGRQGRQLSPEQRTARVEYLVKRLFCATSANQEVYADVMNNAVLTVDFQQFLNQANTNT